METIFLKTLKRLIKQQLTPLSTIEQGKSASYIHNNLLSLNQQTIIDDLENTIIRYSGAKSDADSVEHLVNLINTAREKVQPEREGQKKPKDLGDTITCFTQLALHVTDLYKKISTLDSSYAFPLLDVPFKKNPLHLVYEMVIYYLGEQIFDPNKNIDVTTRAKKEAQLGKRVSSLTERIKPEHSLEEQRTRAQETLKDLETDNNAIVSGEKNLLSTAISKLSIWGWSLDINLTSGGRLGLQLAKTALNIKNMKDNEFEPLLEEEHIAEPM